MADIIGGYAFPSQTLKGNKGPRVIRISDISEKGFVNSRLVRYNGPTISDNYQVRENDILMAMTGGTVGKSLFVTYLPEEMLLNQRVAIIRNQWITSEYINLVLKAPHVMAIVNDRKNSTNDNISMVDIYNFLVPLPCVSQQKKIVEQYYVLLPEIERYNEAQDRLDTLNKSIHERLRKSILQEAIQGKLVEQDQTEEPVSVLLERIRVEKNRLIKEGKLKKKDVVDSAIFKGEDNKYYEKIDGKTLDISEEIPFDLPESWCWCRFASIVHYRIGKTPARGETAYWEPGTIPWVSISDMKDYGTVAHTKESVSPKATTLLGQKSPRGTLLMSFKLTVGRTAVLDIDAYHNEAIISIWPFWDSSSLQPYLFYTLPVLANLGDSKDAIKGKTLNTSSINNLLIPLPPSAEQMRIVNRIKELYRHL